MNEIRTRSFDRHKDFDQLQRLNISVETDRMFRVETLPNSELRLVSFENPSSLEKRFPLNLDADAWSDGWVVEEDGRIRGFIAWGLSDWNRRFVIWHFYVDKSARHRGFGRLLMGCALSKAREWGARTVWAETTGVAPKTETAD